MAPHPISAGSGLTQRSLPLRVVTRRQRHVRRNVVVLIAMMAFLLLITLAGRDQQDVRRCRSSLEGAVAVLRDRVEPGLPDDFPRQDQEKTVAASHYDYRPGNLVAESLVSPFALVGCNSTHSLFLDTDGRHVVLYDGKDFEIRWMTETEFRERASSIGLAVRTAGAD